MSIHLQLFTIFGSDGASSIALCFSQKLTTPSFRAKGVHMLRAAPCCWLCLLLVGTLHACWLLLLLLLSYAICCNGAIASNLQMRWWECGAIMSSQLTPLPLQA